MLESRIVAECSSRDHSDLLATEWEGGSRRANRQTSARHALVGAAGTPVAWALVTCYYEAFFDAHMVLRALGRIVTYVTKEQALRLAGARGSSVSPGTYCGTARRRVADDTVSIELRRCDRLGAHEAVWKQAASLGNVTRAYASSNAVQIARRFKELLTEDAGRSPQGIRNSWNYRRAALYGSIGEGVRGTFRSLSESPSRAFGWASSPPRDASTLHREAASIVFLATQLRAIVDATRPFILPDEKD